MNRGHVLNKSAAVPQIMGGNPNWWNINTMKIPVSHQFLLHHQEAPTSTFIPQFSPTLPPSSSLNDNQEYPESLSQLLLGGLIGGEDYKSSVVAKNWEEEVQIVKHQSQNGSPVVKQDYNMYGHGSGEFQQHSHTAAEPTWSHAMLVSSPKSCVTTLSSNNNMVDFSHSSQSRHPRPPLDHSSECNSRVTSGAACKKARVQTCTTQSTFKVRKEKLGDRITALHQLVSPFGKTDTASVLLESIGYIRFLQNQIEALSLPYLGSGSGNRRQQQPSVQKEGNCFFPEDPGQLLNDICLKRKQPSDKDHDEEPKKDLRSRGLCLVPISSTLQVGSENGADYWAPALGRTFQ